MTPLEQIDDTLNKLKTIILDDAEDAVVIFERMEFERLKLLNHSSTLERIRARGNKSSPSPRACPQA